MIKQWGLLTGLITVIAGLPAAYGDSLDTAAAYSLLQQRVLAARSGFFVYQDADSGFNHGFPSGFFGATGKLTLDTACVDDPAAGSGCTTNATALDRARGTVIRVTFSPLLPYEYVGLNLEEPEKLAENSSGAGYDLRPSGRLELEARSPTPGGVSVQFGVNCKTTEPIHIPQQPTYTPLSISLNALPNLASNCPYSSQWNDVRILFTVVTNGNQAPAGGTVLLDNIRFKPTPDRQQSVLGFPLGNQTFGVVPVKNAVTGQTLPSDQVLRNLTTLYESALTLLALLERGNAADLNAARVLADTFVYALEHDNHGNLLPAAPDGSTGLHNAYESGAIALLNRQPVGAAQPGDVRLAGFSAGTGLCGASGYCLLLDGATGGNNAFAILALLSAYNHFGDERYLQAARVIGRWIVGNLTDTSGTGYGGYFLGYPDEGKPKVLLRGKSVENNADIFAAFTALAAIERQLRNIAGAQEWMERAYKAGDFLMRLFDSTSGCFFAGTVPSGTPPGPGITPDGPQAGDDIINTFKFSDSNTFTLLAMAASPRYRQQIEWSRPMQCVLDRFSQSIVAGGLNYHGFNITENPTEGVNGIAWEFTGQTVVVMRWLDTLYGQSQFTQPSGFYLGQLRQTQQYAPFGDGQGVVASTLQNGDELPPIQQCLHTSFQCIPERVGLAATVWALFASRDFNPLFLVYPLAVNKTGTGSGTVTSNLGGIDCGLHCEEGYFRNTTVTLTATPSTDSEFSGWSGAGCSSANPCTVTMDQARTVTAAFALRDRPKLIAPTGMIDGNNPTYHWPAIASATWYYLWVNDASGNRIRQWYTAAQVGCASGSGECAITLADPLQGGTGQCWVQPYSASGYGSWSGCMLDYAMPTYRWQAVPSASWYYLWVNDASGNRIRQWYTAAQVGCASGSDGCTVTPTVALQPGAGQWWVQAYGASGYGPWSDGLNFTVVMRPVLIAPTGTINNPTPTYRWRAVTGATWYYLWVNGVSGNRIKQWYTAAQVGCGSGSGECAVTPTVALQPGAGQWWVQAYGATGYGPWSLGLPFVVP